MIVFYIFLGIVALAGVAHMLMRRTGVCPTCGQAMTYYPSLNRCPNCKLYSYAGLDFQLRRLEPGYVADTPRFVVWLTQLKCSMDISLRDRKLVCAWQWPRPDRCCVCNKNSTRTETIEVRLLESSRAYVWVYDVGHCSEHKGGVFFYDPASKNDAQLQFRSYDMYLEFLALNGKDPAHALGA